jgi:hypothetical protein
MMPAMARLLAEGKHFRQCTNITDKNQNHSTLQNASLHGFFLDRTRRLIQLDMSVIGER